jgi:hypothetical protein
MHLKKINGHDLGVPLRKPLVCVKEDMKNGEENVIIPEAMKSITLRFEWDC